MAENKEGISLAMAAAIAQAFAQNIPPDKLKDYVEGWLDDHPEATTTVEDGSITLDKLASDASGAINGKADKNNPTVTGALSNGRKSNTTVGMGSIAYGHNVEASGDYAIATGASTTASGLRSRADNSFTTASGSGAHAEGNHTVASGNYSHAQGTHTIASGDYSTALGAYNVEDNLDDVEEWVSLTHYNVGDYVKRTTESGGETTVRYYLCNTENTDETFTSSKWDNLSGKMHYLEIVGNGKLVGISDAHRSNARTLDLMGNERLMGDVFVKCNEDSSGGTKVATVTEVEALSEAIVPLTPSATSGDVGKFLKAKTVSGGKVTEYEFASAGGGGSVDLFYVTPEDYGAVGDGETDDSQAVQDACDAGYAVYFASNKTYYLASPVTIDHDCHLFGGENTVIKTATPSGGTVDNGIVISGTLKKTTTLTSDYTSSGETDNCNNKFTLSDMSGIEVGDLMSIKATDQYYHLARQYYYLGTTLMITDVYDGHIYTSDDMPWNIENTENVSVKIYSAPTVIIENLNFVSDLDSLGAYKYLLSLDCCKNSTIKNCTFKEMANGIEIRKCVNTEVDCVSLAKSKYDNDIEGDGYGIMVIACKNTLIQRVIATCAQHAVAITGSEGVSVDTFVRFCNFNAECRAPGLDTHECTYNLIVEDCTLATAVLNATCEVNRCKVFTNRRANGTGNANITIYGSHNPEWSRVRISNTEFIGAGIAIIQTTGQDPIRSYDNVFGSIEIENCKGGDLNITMATTSMILSNTINELTIKNWTDCEEIYNQPNGKIKRLIVEDSTFEHNYFINNHSSALSLSNIEYFDFRQTEPRARKIIVNRDTNGENVVIPKRVTVNVSSANNAAKFRLCGANVVSDNVDDYIVGSVSGSTGDTLTRTPVSGTGKPTVSMNQDGELVYSQGSGTSKYCVYPVGMFRISGTGEVEISALLVNSGQTTGATFSAGLAIVNQQTGKITTRSLGTPTQATSAGASASKSLNVYGENIVLAYFYCSTPVASAETTFKNHSVRFNPVFAPMTDPNEEDYTADRRTGDGALTSVNGVNNIMCSEQNFHVSFAADLVNNPI